MSYRRTTVQPFTLANEAYVNATVTFYTVDVSTFLRTDTLATLYDATSGSGTLPNPYTLDGDGKFSAPVYIDTPVIAVISESEIGSHSTGIISPDSGGWQGTWETNTTYLPGDLVIDGANGANTGNIYACAIEHTSGSWLTDLGEARWDVAIDVQVLLTNNYIATDGVAPSPEPSVASSDAFAIGEGCSVSTGSQRSVVIGHQSTLSTSSNDTVLIGQWNEIATGNDESVIIGNNNATQADAFFSVIIGRSVFVLEDSSSVIAIGDGAYIDENSTGAIAIGSNAYVDTESDEAIVIGAGSASGALAIAIGISEAGAAGAISIGIGSTSSSYGASAQEAVAIGYRAKASGVQAIAAGGNTITANGVVSTAIGGQQNTSAGTGSVVIGGFDNQTSNNYCTVLGGQKARATHHGEVAHASGNIAVQGDAQYFTLNAFAQVSGAATAELFLDTAGSARASLPNDSAWAFDITIVIRRTDTDGFSARFKRSGCIDRSTNAASTALVGTVDTIGADKNDSTYAVTISADTTNGSLKVEVTGVLGHTINASARIDIVQTIG